MTQFATGVLRLSVGTDTLVVGQRAAFGHGRGLCRLESEDDVRQRLTRAMSNPGADTRFHVKVNMIDETKVADGGTCDEAVRGGKCSDAYGSWFSLSTDGAWKRITIRFADRSSFRQEGWGIGFPWNPTHVTSIQVQSEGSEVGELYDFWLDDFYLTK